MDKPVRCHCGCEISAKSEDALIAAIRRHARQSHAMALTAEQALAIAIRQELEHGFGHGAKPTQRRKA
jgi:predicted small metal-binding protein